MAHARSRGVCLGEVERGSNAVLSVDSICFYAGRGQCRRKAKRAQNRKDSSVTCGWPLRSSSKLDRD
jgi:hypothetical protein